MILYHFTSLEALEAIRIEGERLNAMSSRQRMGEVSSPLAADNRRPVRLTPWQWQEQQWHRLLPGETFWGTSTTVRIGTNSPLRA